MADESLMEKIVSLAKRRGFIFPGSEIYGGLAGTWDYGPLGVSLKNNVKNLWWKMFVLDRDDMYGVDAAIIMNPKAWEASGHVSGFSDPLVECTKCGQRFRADQLDGVAGCSKGGKHEFGPTRQFNMMFKTSVGADDDSSSAVYLRPETAGGMFVNFKNVVDSIHPKLPFGLAQIGKAFRNEIAPRDFVFRSREFEQMEVEFFVRKDEWKEAFEMWKSIIENFATACGITIIPTDIAKADLAHYSEKTIDFEFEYPFGQKELWGLAYRTDFDLTAHQEHSKQKLEYVEDDGSKTLPHVIEPSLGVDRTILAILCSAYAEEGEGEDTRVVLKFPPQLAPVKAAVFPLLKNKPELVQKAREVYQLLKKDIPQVVFDDNGNIGKRYRRQDEIGTPYTITIDFDTLGEKPELIDTVTVRDRDTGEQERLSIVEAIQKVKTCIS